ncbi:hypothetical protein [Oceanobacillus arenosus]|uniref:hypothetical protein n=1 Tax=Oceanobacillus arenosus TaxID=1229153 RepID=UPI001FE8EF33|nr:hypothetical protein [Oceanobacillus arenosus]
MIKAGDSGSFAFYLYSMADFIMIQFIMDLNSIQRYLEKSTGKNPEIVKITEEQLSTKPPYSRDPEKWQKKGGKIEISEEGI